MEIPKIDLYMKNRQTLRNKRNFEQFHKPFLLKSWFLCPLLTNNLLCWWGNLPKQMLLSEHFFLLSSHLCISAEQHKQLFKIKKLNLTFSSHGQHCHIGVLTALKCFCSTFPARLLDEVVCYAAIEHQIC